MMAEVESNPLQVAYVAGEGVGEEKEEFGKKRKSSRGGKERLL